MGERITYGLDRRRAWFIGGFALVVAFFCVVLLVTAFGTDAGFNLFGFPVPEVTWLVVWGAIAAFAATAGIRSIHSALDHRPALTLDDEGITYRLEITGERRVDWNEVTNVEVKAMNRSLCVVRVHHSGGRRMDVRPDLLVGAAVEEVAEAIERRWRER